MVLSGSGNSELKRFLAANMTFSLVGQRNLLLLIDALDEYDLATTHTAVRTCEELVGSTLSEGTNFNICLSSRYWPQTYQITSWPKSN